MGRSPRRGTRMTEQLDVNQMQRSEQCFERARAVLVGGVNSPVRAFRAVGGRPVFLRAALGPCRLRSCALDEQVLPVR